jgi:hypothetical protein
VSEIWIGADGRPARQIKPIWTSSTFLVYVGGLTVLGGAIGALVYLSKHFPGRGEGTAWTFFILMILYAIAVLFLVAGRSIAAGIFAFSSVIAWAIFVAVLFSWFGWTGGGSFHDWSWARLFFEILLLVVALAELRIFRFPFIALISTVVGWFFVIDLISSGGNWTLTVSLLVGLAYFLAGAASGKPSAFWLHLVAGLLVGVPILVWCHTSTFDFAVIAFMSLLYVALGHATRRSTWAFYGTIGFFIVTIHFLVGSPTGIVQNAVAGQPPSISAWSFPLAFGLLGFWLVFLGLLGRRRRAAAAVDPMPA